VCVATPADDATVDIPIFELVIKGISVTGSIVGTRQDLAEIFALHAEGRTRVIAESRRIEDVNDASRTCWTVTSRHGWCSTSPRCRRSFPDSGPRRTGPARRIEPAGPSAPPAGGLCSLRPTGVPATSCQVLTRPGPLALVRLRCTLRRWTSRHQPRAEDTEGEEKT
jgi:hypothetical protein